MKPVLFAVFCMGTPIKALVATPSRSRAFGILKASTCGGNSDVTRTEFLMGCKAALGLGTTAATFLSGSIAPALAEVGGEAVTLDSGVSYTVTKSGNGPAPSLGELVGVRFKAICGDNVIDDIFDTPEPYYTRVGAGGLLKGVEEVIPKMRVGDRWSLTIPGPLAFGSKGRPASAGKPRIPANATILFEIEMVGLPGREPELIDIIGDD